jgi:hypothetical protein
LRFARPSRTENAILLAVQRACYGLQRFPLNQSHSSPLERTLAKRSLDSSLLQTFTSNVIVIPIQRMRVNDWLQIKHLLSFVCVPISNESNVASEALLEKEISMINRFTKTVFFTGVPFGLFMGLFFALIYKSSVAFASGLACGLAFGLIMAIFTETQRKRMQSKDGRLDGEMIIFQGPANHFLKAEGRGGWLTLTPSRLVFRSHGMNVQNQSLDIAIREIADIVPTLTLGLIPNGLRVVLQSGQKESFVVNTRKKWIKLIAEQMQG